MVKYFIPSSFYPYFYLCKGTNPHMGSIKAGDCSSTYCNNRGVCASRKTGGYDCHCSTGWKGAKCELRK